MDGTDGTHFFLHNISGPFAPFFLEKIRQEAVEKGLV
jgi:hypothetical protein